MKQKSALREPPLVEEEFEEIDPVTGGKVKVVRFRRGLLGEETRSYEMLHPGIFDTKTDRENLEDFCNHLRDQLSAVKLPSDRIPKWINRTGDWEPLTDELRHLPAPYKYQHWTKRIEDLTEPLTIERSAGELLFAATSMMQHPEVDSLLWHILQFAKAYAQFRVLVRYNTLAHQALCARRARKRGPEVRRKIRAERTNIICQHADRYWAASPMFRKHASNTAAVIVNEVNQELKEKQLLPKGKERLSVKTISDHIRAGRC